MKHIREYYFAPVVEVLYVAAEYGFAGSMFEDPIEQPEQDW